MKSTIIKNECKNPNHPKKGSRTTVDPIRNVKDIDSIKKLIANKPRDLLLFTMGINNGLRSGDLLKLKVRDVKNLKPGEFIKIKESKTGKENLLMVNKSVYKVLQNYLEKLEPEDDAPLFKSKKGGGPLRVETVNVLIKGWCKALNLNSGNYGAHSLRKTFGYQQRTKYGVGFEVIAKRFNHSSPAITMRYLGIEDKEVNGILQNEI